MNGHSSNCSSSSSSGPLPPPPSPPTTTTTTLSSRPPRTSSPKRRRLSSFLYLPSYSCSCCDGIVTELAAMATLLQQSKCCCNNNSSSSSSNPQPQHPQHKIRNNNGSSSLRRSSYSTCITHPNRPFRLILGRPLALLLLYASTLLMMMLLASTSTNLHVDTTTGMQHRAMMMMDASFLSSSQQLFPFSSSNNSTNTGNSGQPKTANTTTSLPQNDWDKDRDYWIQHIQKRQRYVRNILDRVPIDVQYKSVRGYVQPNGYAEPEQCQARFKMYGKKGRSVLSKFDRPRPQHSQQRQGQQPSDDTTTNDKHKHAIVIPFRDRDFHLQHFQKYMSSYLQHHYGHTNHTFKLYIVEQNDTAPFQRGFLMNAALDHLDHDVSCVTMHDVDLVPIFFSPVPYETCARPTRLINKMQTFDWKIPYDRYFGGIVNLHQQHWAVINGMGNQFQGWGAEDDELYQRLVYRALVNCGNGNPATPLNKDHGNFMAISQDKEHHNDHAYGRNYQMNVKLLERHKWAGVSNSYMDGWSHNRYEVTGHEIQYTREDPLLNGFEEIHTIRVTNRIEKLPLRMIRPHMVPGQIKIPNPNPTKKTQPSNNATKTTNPNATSTTANHPNQNANPKPAAATGHAETPSRVVNQKQLQQRKYAAGGDEKQQRKAAATLRADLAQIVQPAVVGRVPIPEDEHHHQDVEAAATEAASYNQTLLDQQRDNTTTTTTAAVV